jgi:hypothetical protein
MKRFLLVCSLVVAACSCSYAQAVIPHPIPTPVLKPEFTAKVAELNAFIGANNMPAANAKWSEIATLMNNELIVTRYKMQDAMDIHDEAGKTHYMDISKMQRGLYGQTLQLKNDMVANQAALSEKLTTFANAIL